MKNLIRKTRWEKAQAMVEFALIIPILLALLYGIIEFGRLLFIYSAVTTASREAARYGSAAGKGAGVTIDLSSSKYNDCEGIRAAARRSAIALTLPDSAINISYDSGPGTAKISTTCPTPIFNLGDRIVVTITNNYSPILPVPWLDSIPIRSTTGRTILKDIRVEGTPVALGTYAPRLSFFVDRQEVDEGVGTVEVTVLLDTPATDTVTAPLFVSGTASPDDYTISPASITIPAGDTYTRLTITINDDTIDEYDEQLKLVLGPPVNAEPGTPFTFTLTIVDNDEPPFISFQTPSQTVLESVGSLAIPVVLTDAAGVLTYSGKTVTVDFTFAGTAILGADYSLSAAPLTIPPGQSAGFIIVTIVGPDRLDEDDETIVLDLANPVEAKLTAPTEHTITVQDVDVPKISFARPVAVLDETISRVSIQVLMDIPSTKNISVDYTVAGSAELNVDYRLGTTTIVFPAGKTSSSISFEPILDDITEQPYETADITLTKPANADLGAIPTTELQIYDTYEAPTASFSLPSIRVSEKSGQFVLIVGLSRYANQDVTVPFSISGTATTGTGVDDDYSYTPATVVIPQGELDGTITFSFVADGIDEDDETILVTMQTPTGASIGTPSTTLITLEDADPTPGVYFNGVSKVVAEDVGVVSIPLSLSSLSSKTVTVNFIVAPAPRTNAVVNVDYVAFTNYTVTFPPKTSTATIDVTVLDNPSPDLDPRDLVLVLQSPPVNATLGTPNNYTLTIRDVQVCPRFVSSSRDNNAKTITLYIANDKDYATNVYIDTVTVTWPLAATQEVNRLTWKDPAGLQTMTTSTPKDTPILVFGSGLTWTLYIPGSTPEPPVLGYPLELLFKDPLSPIATYTVSVKFSNGCVRERSTTASNP